VERPEPQTTTRHQVTTRQPQAKTKPKPKPTPRPGVDVPLRFGQAFTWKPGITVKVGKPKPYHPSQYAAVGKGKNHVAFLVTLVKKTGKTFDPTLIYMTMQSGNVEAQAIYDENGVGDTPQTKLLDGREAQFKVGFTVKNPQDLVFEMSPDANLTYKSALAEVARPSGPPDASRYESAAEVGTHLRRCQPPASILPVWECAPAGVLVTRRTAGYGHAQVRLQMSHRYICKVTGLSGSVHRQA
jgi:hypothetical protein